MEYQECGFSAILRGRSFKRPYSLSDPGLTAYLECTLLELSNDVKFVEILVKTAENTIRYSEPPYKFAYACRSHDRVQLPLDTVVVLYKKPGGCPNLEISDL